MRIFGSNLERARQRLGARAPTPSHGALTWLSASVLAWSCFACSGSDSVSSGPGLSDQPGQQGPAGVTGPIGPVGPTGPSGADGKDTNTATQALSLRAHRGFEISPVPITFSSSTTIEKLELIGYGSYLVNAAGDCATCHGMAPARQTGGDGGARDGGLFGDGGTLADGGRDGGRSDSGASDGGRSDGGRSDSGLSDGGRADGGTLALDAGSRDGATGDGGMGDGATGDGSTRDGSTTDGSTTDGSTTDGGGTGGMVMGFLAGGTPFSEGAITVYSRNLTPDPTTGMKLTEAQFIRSMRTGEDFRHSGQQLLVMPWPTYRWMGDHELRAIYAYLRAIPAVTNRVPDDQKGPAGMLMPVPFPMNYDEGDVERPLPEPGTPDQDNIRRGYAIQPLETPMSIVMADAETQADFGRGSFLVNAVAGCNDCHTNPPRNMTPGANYLDINTAAYLSGGRVFDVPPQLQQALGQRRTMSENLSGQNNGFNDSLVEFLTIIDEGVHADEPDRRPLGWPMPWHVYRNLVAEDLISIYTYITMVPRRTGENDKITQPWARWCETSADCDPMRGETCRAASNECVSATCADRSECGACQTCEATACTVTSTTTSCFTSGI